MKQLLFGLTPIVSFDTCHVFMELCRLTTDSRQCHWSSIRHCFCLSNKDGRLIKSDALSEEETLLEVKSFLLEYIPCKFFLLEHIPVRKGFNAKESKQEVTEVVSLSQNGRKSTKCIQSLE